MASLFESYERRIDKINAVLAQYGINGVEDAKAICAEKGLDPYKTCEETQPICFENAKWAYVVGAAIAIKKGCKNAADAAEAIGEGLQAFCIPGSVADDRKVGIGHGSCARRRSASPSWPATNRSPQPRAPSRSPKWPTRCARTRCA